MQNKHSKSTPVVAAVALLVACGGQGVGVQQDNSAQGPQATGTSAGMTSTGAANDGGPEGSNAPLSNPNQVTDNSNPASNPNTSVNPNILDADKFRYIFSAGISPGVSVSANTWAAFVFTDDPNACSSGNLRLKPGQRYFWADFNQEHGDGGAAVYLTSLESQSADVCELYTKETDAHPVGSMVLSAGRLTYSIKVGGQPAVMGTIASPPYIPGEPDSIVDQSCNMPTNTVGYDFSLLDPNSNHISCVQ